MKYTVEMRGVGRLDVIDVQADSHTLALIEALRLAELHQRKPSVYWPIIAVQIVTCNGARVTPFPE